VITVVRSDNSRLIIDLNSAMKLFSAELISVGWSMIGGEEELV